MIQVGTIFHRLTLVNTLLLALSLKAVMKVLLTPETRSKVDMKKAHIAAAFVAAFCATGQAGAASFTLGPVNSGPQAPIGFETINKFITFDNGDTMGLAGGSLETGSNGTIYANPAGDTTQYYAVGPSEGSPASIAISAFDRVSLYWGSIDYYNTISFLGAGGTAFASFTGAQLVGGSPNGAESHTVTFTLTPTERAEVTGISFSSSVNAFEFDNLAIGSAPEPATWATLLLGFGLTGATLRRRGRAKTSLRYA